MLAWIWRLLIAMAAPITALFVSRNALNFGTVETLIAIVLIIGFAVVAAGWTLRNPPRDPF
jgi:hypothetical protein